MWKDKKVAILGWGINGEDALEFLKDKNVQISIYDRKKIKDLKFENSHIRGVDYYLGEDYLKKGLEEYDVIIRAPGVYRYLPEIVKAENSGVKVTSVTNLFFDLCPAKIIGVTGTKGKGTTSSLIYEILKKDGKDVFLAGNIGAPMLKLLPNLKPKSWVVLELSSFQLIDSNKSPHIAVILNITQDHLDWHKSEAEYFNAKTRILTYQKKRDYAVLAYDYKKVRKLKGSTKAKVYFFSSVKKLNDGAYVNKEKIFLKKNNKKYTIGSSRDLLLRGKHNWENVCASVCAGWLTGAKVSSIKKAVFSFKGLNHRLEQIRVKSGIIFINDSFSTNPQTTVAAIKSFSQPITIILGGFDKKLDYGQMAQELRKSSVKNIILIGDIANKLRVSIKKAGFQGSIYNLGYSDMESVVAKAYEISNSGSVVLLSPATSSFDMFKDYKQRGDVFRSEVNKL